MVAVVPDEFAKVSVSVVMLLELTVGTTEVIHEPDAILVPTMPRPTSTPLPELPCATCTLTEVPPEATAEATTAEKNVDGSATAASPVMVTWRGISPILERSDPI